MSWVDAIKKYSELTSTKFAIPKRDSPEYAKIKSIQDKLARGEEIATVPRAKPVRKVKPVPAVADSQDTKGAVRAADVPAPAKLKPVKKENTEEPPKVYPIEIKKVKVRTMKVKPAEPIPEPVIEPVKEVKKPRQPKQPKQENVEEAPKVFAPEVKVESLSPKQIREAKQAAKAARLEAQAKKQSEHNVQKLRERLTISREPVVLDFS